MTAEPNLDALVMRSKLLGMPDEWTRAWVKSVTVQPGNLTPTSSLASFKYTLDMVATADRDPAIARALEMMRGKA